MGSYSTSLQWTCRIGVSLTPCLIAAPDVWGIICMPKRPQPAPSGDAAANLSLKLQCQGQSAL